MNNPDPKVIISNCPSCQGLVKVPGNAPASSEARCPHCKQDFAIAAILADAIPELQVVAPAEPEPPEEEKPQTSNYDTADPSAFVLEASLRSAAEKKERRPRSSNEESGTTDDSNQANSNASFAISEAGEESSRSKSEGKNSDSRRRTSRSERSGSERGRSDRAARQKSSRPTPGKPSPIFEVMKIASGGLFAIPIAYALVLGLFQKDPLGLMKGPAGPILEKYAPFIVPDKFKSGGDEMDKASTE